MSEKGIDSPRQHLIAVVGQTATSKTALAVQIALRHNGEVISADSRQVYRGLDLGTGKVTPEEMRGVPHHLLNVVNPNDAYSVVRFQREALEAIADIHSRGKLPILCGGTGQYIDAILDDVSLPDVDPNPELRASLAHLSTHELLAHLTQLDPRRASTIEPENPHRLIRAIEIATACGAVPELAPVQPRFNALVLGCRYADTQLYRTKIRTRIIERITAGMFDEAERILAEGVSLERMSALGLEYGHLSAWISAGAHRDEAMCTAFVDALELDIWGYARRQRTWFKRRESIEWIDVDIDDEIGRALLRVDTFTQQ
jgi:tRNA dimethylallyltransferase